MEQYIKKTDVVSKINNWRDEIKKGVCAIPLSGRQRADATFEYEILGIVRDFIDTLEVKEVQEEHVNEKLEEAVNTYIGFAPEVDECSSVYGKRQAFKAGAKWQFEQFEKNRLAACDKQTKEEAEIEINFATSIIEKEHRLPTYNDAIKYGMALKEQQKMNNYDT